MEEQKMEEQKGVCSRCCNFDRYYKLGICTFFKSDYGWCREKKQHTERHEYCEAYRHKQWKPRASKRLIEKTLTDMNATLDRIGQLIAAEREERKERNE